MSHASLIFLRRPPPNLTDLGPSRPTSLTFPEPTLSSESHAGPLKLPAQTHAEPRPVPRQDHQDHQDQLGRPDTARPPGLGRFNSLPPERAEAELLTCCGS
ncbi:hypothetical protein QR77_25575, partial [Streptomyces sp. 150FB]